MPNRLGLPPPRFAGNHSDWDDFEQTFRAYMSVWNPAYEEMFAKISEVKEEISDSMFLVNGTPNPETMALSYQLRWVLLNVCEGSSKAVLRASPSKHGFELWRLLRQRYAGSSELTALSLLTDIVQTKFNMSDF